MRSSWTPRRTRADREGEAARACPALRSGRGRVVVQGLLQIVLDLTGGVLEFLDAFAHAAGEFGEFLGSEKDKNDGEHQKHFRHAHSKS